MLEVVNCNLLTGIIPQGIVSRCQHVRGCLLLNLLACFVSCKVTGQGLKSKLQNPQGSGLLVV